MFPCGEESIQSPHKQTDQPLAQQGVGGGGAASHPQVWAYQSQPLPRLHQHPFDEETEAQEANHRSQQVAALRPQSGICRVPLFIVLLNCPQNAVTAAAALL